MVLSDVFELYKKNFKVALAFAILLVFAFVFSLFPNVFISSGSLLFDYNFNAYSPEILILEFAALAIFTAVFAFFVSLTVFSVRKELSSMRVEYYLSEMVQKFSSKLFAFFLLYTVFLSLVSFGIVFAGLPVWVAAIIVFLVSSAVFFVPQAIVVDEESVENSVYSSAEFALRNPRLFLVSLVVPTALMAAALVLEFAFDSFLLLGKFVSLFLVLVFIVPFTEMLKTYVYMMKFEIIKHHEKLRPRNVRH
ncbi:MAG: hypothetical protein HY394_06125 [Candidatus Diapherotrites archaeon]|nr:hypothetical protein [Candidatus Diapherotrites archaeon]